MTSRAPLDRTLLLDLFAMQSAIVESASCRSTGERIDPEAIPADLEPRAAAAFGALTADDRKVLHDAYRLHAGRCARRR